MSQLYIPPSPTTYDREMSLPGAVAPMYPWSTVAAVALTASRSHFARFVPSKSFAVTKIAFVTTVAATENDNVDVGIYNAAGEKLVSSGATAGKLNATAGVQTVAITSTTLAAGTVYYAALAYGATAGTPATALCSNAVNVKATGLFSTTIPGLVQGIQAGQATLPTSATIAEGVNVPVLALRES